MTTRTAATTLRIAPYLVCTLACHVGGDSSFMPGAGATETVGTSMDGSMGGPVASGSGTGADATGTASQTSGGPGTKFDLESPPDSPGEANCMLPEHVPCDHLDDDPWHALGLSCPGELQVTSSESGMPEQIFVHAGQVGTYQPPTFPVREGEKLVILSTGIAEQLLDPAAGVPPSDTYQGTAWGNTSYDAIVLPPPLRINKVSEYETCADNPALIGAGDCSNTIEDQWLQGGGAYDYVELRFETEVPQGVFGFSYDFAFFTMEYPQWYDTHYNDMYVAWLESEQWTGNVSFDDMGRPISLNAGFLDYKDGHHPVHCPGCTAPELEGTQAEGHAATRWLTSTASVTPGEHMTMVFAIFDKGDASWDSIVILDNFQWQCEDDPPVTKPAG